MSCSIGWLKGVAEGFFLEMREKFVENDFFKDFRLKWKIRNGAAVFQKIFVKWWLFQQRFNDGSLQITWYNASGKRCVDRQDHVKLFIKKHGGNAIKFTIPGRWTVWLFLRQIHQWQVQVSKGFPAREVSGQAAGFGGGKLFPMVRIFSVK